MGTWLGIAAVLWALDEAPDVPAPLVSTLLVVARYAGQDGRGAHPSAPTVAAQTRKSESQAKRDLAALERLGLITRGDQRIVAHIRADRRPTVYDLPITSGPVDNPLRGSTDDTPSGRRAVAPMHARGVIQGPNGVAPVLPEKIRRRSGTRGRASANGARAAPPWCGQCDEATRLIDEDAPRRCPACHPLAVS